MTRCNVADIYTIAEPESLYHEDRIEFQLLCKKTLGGYVEGKLYYAKLEFYKPSADTNWKEFRSCWVKNDKTGSRFAVSGNTYNVYNGGKGGIDIDQPYWRHFSEIFCSLADLREQQINSILND